MRDINDDLYQPESALAAVKSTDKSIRKKTGPCNCRHYLKIFQSNGAKATFWGQPQKVRLDLFASSGAFRFPGIERLKIGTGSSVAQ